MYRYVDYFDRYGRIMQFNKNKLEPVHRWYPFVEGYSKDFIKSIIDEFENKNLVCLEPFSGSGTTALELQNMGIKCISFEVNPLMYLIGKVKLYSSYSAQEALEWHNYIIAARSNYVVGDLYSIFNTLYEGENKEKWNFDKDVAIAVEKLRGVILSITQKEYRELFLVALSSILLEVSNLYRNGKCLSYKENWKDLRLTSQDVYKIFDKKIKDEIIPDIAALEQSNNSHPSAINNYQYLYNEDCRSAIDTYAEDGSIDIVITSPPYLNSRDYTDTYMLELKTLRFTKSFEEIRALRNKTIRSHVQIKWTDTATIDNRLLSDTLSRLKTAAMDAGSWNESIIDMVRLYFVDMQTLFKLLYKKVKIGGRIYFNISNSAYFGVKINTLGLCASIAESEGFQVLEIRKARYLKTSPQQKKDVNKLLEGVLLLERKSNNE